MRIVSKDGLRKMLEASKRGSENRKNKLLNQYLIKLSYCLFCGKELSYEKRKNKFCDNSCSASYNNLGVRRHGKTNIKYCSNCGKKIIGKQFCSRECQKEWYYYQYIFRWFMGVESGKKGSNQISQHVKKFLIEQNGYKCDICGNTEWQGKPIPLEVDHVDGDSENNILGNLRLICPNCHAQTETYKGKNLGKGRYKRRQRYKDGKSY